MSRRAIIEKSLAKDFSDEKTQAEILQPEGVHVNIGGSSVRLYPLSAFDLRRFIGLAQLVIASADGPGPATVRIAGALNLDYAPRFVPFLAIATFEKPPEPSESRERAKQLEHLIEDINSKASADELAAAFFVMLGQNNVFPEDDSTAKK